ncbi:prealbumin-like fold domain-containing protein [Clostridium tertium]|jgi:predicted DNA binding CopG/RHH family protein|uniref:SpaA isopeptide-forming pilin-related protein n=1 Tax=Clostridium TaxID=1485 RepID=UPI00115B6CF9|nr:MULTISPECIES: prealbumin-like fold domain-containing protein [Clostridium]MBS5307438.1 calcium-binding protein [Clostridium sp.]MBS6502036.1 calcium-binding protein [Clostridium sp.]MDB1924464.1 prealbumin-like fold domain-containing protein [Clostridium tertium]MDB1927914.1 prealbumin-like fold domain-containing protein [Clostridium tertium]MDB1931537.1 prealbumin-like fold domain-containing protein [Clostridium tertium]
MKIVIDDQYHSDENNNNNEDQYTVDENGNLNLFIQVDGEVGEDNSTRTINRDNICNTQEEEIIESEFSEEKCENPYDRLYSNIEDKLEGIAQDSSQEQYNSQYNSQYSSENNFNSYNVVEAKGRIEIISRLASRDGVELKGARINLYLLNGISPKLYDSKFTDSNGEVVFDNLENGCYRVIAIVDRRFFEKPLYYTWNEVTIDKNNKSANICVVNKIKSAYYRR